jgi:hypothetical protein
MVERQCSSSMLANIKNTFQLAVIEHSSNLWFATVAVVANGTILNT